MKPGLLALIAAAVCAAQQTGSIAGSVTSTSGEPVRNVVLILQAQAAGSQAPQPRAYSAVTDTQGAFAFEALPPASYSLCTSKPGYLRNCHAAIALAAGESVTDANITMTPQSVISGTVTDEYGDPYPNANVIAGRIGYGEGHKQIQRASGSLTNAEGAFTIGGLEAGSYYLMVAPRQSDLAQGAVPKGEAEAFVITYYPGAVDVSAAIPVRVGAGGALRSIDIRVQRTRAYRILGKVAGLADGVRVVVQLIALGGPPAQRPTVMENGAFDFEGVAPGTYILTALARPPSSGGARMMVTIGNRDLENVALQMTAGAEITGTISFDGAAPKLESRLLVGVTSMIGSGGFNSNDPNAKNDGAFAIHHVLPDLYRVTVQQLPPGTYLKSATFGGQDVTKTALDLTSGRGGVLNIVLSPNAGEIDGVVRGTDGKPRPNMLVSLWTPGAVAENAIDFTRFFYGTDQNGAFKFPNLPPGEYRIAAWDDMIDPGLAVAPEFRSAFESEAASVTLHENGHENVEAPVIPRDAIENQIAKLP